jgi:tRNA(fMet)-specific endonuclease VapC
MEGGIVCLDTSILIDFFRKKNKENSAFFKLTQNHSNFAVSTITEFEIYTGSTKEQIPFWDSFFDAVTVLPFDSETAKKAVEISKDLNSRNKRIEIPDIFIATTAIRFGFKLATLNRKHFERIHSLELILSDSE